MTETGRGETLKLLLAYLNDHAVEGRLPPSGVLPDTRYLDTGVLSSLGLVMFIEFAEEAFAVRFSADDLQSYEFRTPSGVAGIIERLRAAVVDG